MVITISPTGMTRQPITSARTSSLASARKSSCQRTIGRVQRASGLDSRGLHGFSWLRVCRLRNGPEGLAAHAAQGWRMSSELYGDLAEVRACEQRIVNCWPAPSTLMIEGFAVRFLPMAIRVAPIPPLHAGQGRSDDADIDAIERLYREAGLPPTFRDTPLMSRATRKRLDRRGYTLKDASFGMIMISRADFQRRADVEIASAPALNGLKASRGSRHRTSARPSTSRRSSGRSVCRPPSPLFGRLARHWLWLQRC